MNINDQVKAGYNAAAKNYSLEFRDQFKNDKHLGWLVERLPVGSTVLDLGCGAGKPVDSLLIEHGMNVIGIDISQAQIELARQYVPEASYIVEDMAKLKNGYFNVDAVVSFYAIFHTSRDTHFDLLKKINSFLKPKGYLLVTMGVNAWEGKEDDFCGVEMYWSHYGTDQNIELVSQAGFEILQTEVDSSGGEEHLIIFATAK